MQYLQETSTSPCTTDAAKNLKKRLGERNMDGATTLPAMTFHSFCLQRLIRVYWRYLGFAKQPGVLANGTAEHNALVSRSMRCAVWNM